MEGLDGRLASSWVAVVQILQPDFQSEQHCSCMCQSVPPFRQDCQALHWVILQVTH